MILRGNCKRIPGTGWEKYTQKIPAANPRYFHLLTTLVSYLFVVGDKVYFYPLLFDRPISKNQLSLGEKNLFFARFRCAKNFSDNFFIFVRAPLQKKIGYNVCKRPNVATIALKRPIFLWIAMSPTFIWGMSFKIEFAPAHDGIYQIVCSPLRDLVFWKGLETDSILVA